MFKEKLNMTITEKIKPKPVALAPEDLPIIDVSAIEDPELAAELLRKRGKQYAGKSIDQEIDDINTGFHHAATRIKGDR